MASLPNTSSTISTNSANNLWTQEIHSNRFSSGRPNLVFTPLDIGDVVIIRFDAPRR